MKRYVITLFVLLAVVAMDGTANAQVLRMGSYVGGEEEYEQSTPPLIEGLPEGAVRLAASNSSSYELVNGRVYAEGNNEEGQLCDGTTIPSPYAPVAVKLPPGVTIIAIAQARNKLLMIDSEHHAWACGSDAHHSLCLPNGDRLEPVKIGALGAVDGVDGAADVTDWIKPGGKLVACGSNDSGLLGVSESVKESQTPVTVRESGVVQVANADLLLTGEGAVEAWGGNMRGQTGTGSTATVVYGPHPVSLPGPASSIGSGGDIKSDGGGCAIVAGQVYTWGLGAYGELANGTKTKTQDTPVRATEAPEAVACAPVSYSLTVLTPGGNVYGWGENAGGQLGQGSNAGPFSGVLIATDALEVSATAEDALIAQY